MLYVHAHHYLQQAPHAFTSLIQQLPITGTREMLKLNSTDLHPGALAEQARSPDSFTHCTARGSSTLGFASTQDARQTRLAPQNGRPALRGHAGTASTHPEPTASRRLPICNPATHNQATLAAVPVATVPLVAAHSCLNRLRRMHSQFWRLFVVVSIPHWFFFPMTAI